MKKLRSHITKWTCLVTVTLGLVLCLVRPVESDHTRDSFARWIQSLQSNAELPDQLRTELNQLKSFDGDFQQMVEQASHLIKQYDSQFKLPFSTDASHSRDLPRQLITEWNFFYQLGDLFDGLPTSKIKPSLSLSIPLWALHQTQKVWQPQTFGSTVQHVQQNRIHIASAIQPMINCIAIGAP